MVGAQIDICFDVTCRKHLGHDREIDPAYCLVNAGGQTVPNAVAVTSRQQWFRTYEEG